jgi:hypothetical protein
MYNHNTLFYLQLFIVVISVEKKKLNYFLPFEMTQKKMLWNIWKNTHGPYIVCFGLVRIKRVTQLYSISSICVGVLSCWVEPNLLEFFFILYRLFILNCHLKSNYHEGWDRINWFNPVSLLCLFQARTCISNIICRGIFSCSIGLRWEVIVRFVVICRIVDHHYLHFLFIITSIYTTTKINTAFMCIMSLLNIIYIFVMNIIPITVNSWF